MLGRGHGAYGELVCRASGKGARPLYKVKVGFLPLLMNFEVEKGNGSGKKGEMGQTRGT